MREPPAATMGRPAAQEPAAERPVSCAGPAIDATSGNAALRMEQVIDRFIWQDGARATTSETRSLPPPIPDNGAAGDFATDIVARLAPRSLDVPDRLPRIVTSSPHIRPTATPCDEGAPAMSARRPQFPFHAIAASARNRRNRLEEETARDRLGGVPEFSTSASWRRARRVITTAAALTCVFSTGVIWAKHRSEMVAEISGPPAEVAIAMPEPAVAGGAGLGQSIRNTPVLIREGASAGVPEIAEAGGSEMTPATTSSAASVTMPPAIVARGIAAGESAPTPPMTPIAPVVRVVPIVPIAPSAPLAERMAAVGPGPSVADAAATPAPPLDRRGLNELATRPAAGEPDHHGPAFYTAKRPKSAIDRRPRHRDHVTRSKPPVRSTDAPASSRGAAPKVARGHVPPDGWDARRQGLRTEPAPEPSMFKKLIGYVWPPGQAWNAPQPAKPAAPTVTSKPFYWSDSGRARP